MIMFLSDPVRVSRWLEFRRSLGWFWIDPVMTFNGGTLLFVFLYNWLYDGRLIIYNTRPNII